jgi:hypothetical protein
MPSECTTDQIESRVSEGNKQTNIRQALQAFVKLKNASYWKKLQTPPAIFL